MLVILVLVCFVDSASHANVATLLSNSEMNPASAILSTLLLPFTFYLITNDIFGKLL